MRRRLKLILLIVFLALVILGGYSARLVFKMKHISNPTETALVERGDIEVTVRETGVVEPIRRVEVKSKVAGMLAALYVEEGDRVEKGQLIARLEAPEVEAQCNQMKAQLDASQARLEQAELSLKRDREVIDSQVKQAQASLRAAQVSVQEAETRCRDAERIYENNRKLFETGGYIPKNDVDAAKASLDLAVQARQTVQERVKEQQAMLLAAEARRTEVPLSTFRVAEAQASVRQTQDALVEIETKLSDAVIRAPSSGVVIAQHVRQGELITAVSYYGAGAPLVTIGDLSRMLVKIFLNEVDIEKIKIGQSVRITADALRGRVQEGHVTRISPASVSDESGIVKFPVEITVTKGQADLKTGMTANIEITSQRAAKVLTVPNDALFQKQGKWRVAVVSGERDGKPIAEEREVKIGLANDARTEIRSGLKEKEKVQLGKSGMPKRKKIDLMREPEHHEESQGQ